MESGMILLDDLHEFVKEASNVDALNGRSAAGRGYSKVAASLIGRVPDTQGFYLWGCYGARGLWQNIYLGKAGVGKTAHLRSRILEELRDERCFLWRTVMPEEALKAIGARHYPAMWHKYRGHWERSFKKAGTTHIAWVSDPALSNADVIEIERDLIETLNPKANLSRPLPPASLQRHTADVVRSFRAAIHSNRPETNSSAPK